MNEVWLFIQCWIIALGALAIYILQQKQKSKDSSFKQWYKENKEKFWISVISAIILMMMFVSKDNLTSIDETAIQISPMLEFIPFAKLISFVIGITNVWLVNVITRSSKKKIKDNERK